MSIEAMNALVEDAKGEVQAVEAKVKTIWVDGVRFWYALWSVRMAILSTILGGLSALLPTWQPALPALPFAILSTVCAALAGVASLVKQPSLLANIEADRQARAEAAAKAAEAVQAAAQAKAQQDLLVSVVSAAALKAFQDAQAQPAMPVTTVAVTDPAAPAAPTGQ